MPLSLLDRQPLDTTREQGQASIMRTMKLGPLNVHILGGADGHGGGGGPAVVFFHGFGAPGDDLVPLARALGVPSEVRLVFPEAPLSLAPYGYGAGRAWWMLDIEEMQRAAITGARQDRTAELPEGMVEARGHVNAMLDAAQHELGFADGQLVLGGFSQGSMVCCDLATTSERALAGLVIWSGTLLAKNVWGPGMARRKGLPVLQSHGQQDPLLPFGSAELLARMWKNAGAGLTFMPFQGGHTIPPAVLAATSEFLREVTHAPSLRA